jgi:CheY-like chemotaxis protein
MHLVRESMPYGKDLVVDDVESNLYVAKRLLTPYDLIVETAGSGFSSIEKIKNGNVYDIVFMDHMMPKMDGMEAVKIIRELGYKHTIVALTANAVIGQAEMFLKNGFDDFISKPIDIRQLDSVLNKFVRGKNKLTQITFEADTEWLAFFVRDAKKAVGIFEATLEKIAQASNEDLKLFAINAHTMKGHLANMRERKISEQAAFLEKAGKEQNKNAIQAETQNFIEALKAIISKIETKINAIPSNAEGDPAYLQKQLQLIIEACTDYNEQAAGGALGNLKKMAWAKETGESLGKISEHLLHSDFEDAKALARELYHQFSPNTSK